MPPRQPPKTYSLSIKTHTVTILVTAPATSTVSNLKQSALAALTNPLNSESLPLPSHCFPKSTDDFELCKIVRSRQSSATTEFEPIPETKVLSACGITNWETLALQFKDENGDPLPIEYSPASVEYEDEENMAVDDEASEKTKGKRKAD